MKDVGIDEGSKGVTTPGSNGEGGAGRQEREQVPGGDCEGELPGSR